MILQSKDVLGLEELSAEEILGVLDVAAHFRAVFDRPVRSVPIMRGRTVVNFFHEPSTRTRISFELAEQRLSADIINFAAATSSFSKGETLRGTTLGVNAHAGLMGKVTGQWVYRASATYLGAIVPGTGDDLGGLVLQFGLGRTFGD